jgi:hypothetical protein
MSHAMLARLLAVAERTIHRWDKGKAEMRSLGFAIARISGGGRIKQITRPQPARLVHGRAARGNDRPRAGVR